MDASRFHQEGSRPGSLRGRIILLVVLPTAVLGATYFLLAEYVFQTQAIEEGARLTLRLGGAGLIFLALVLAAACGYLLVDRVTRPIRLLLWLAENGELLESRSDLLEHGSAEIDALYRMVRVLVSQNKAGAQALEELEALRTALRSLREEVMRTGQHGVLPPIHSLPEGVLAEIGSSLETKRGQLMAFFRDLHERVAGLRSEIESLGKDLGFTVAGELPPPPRPDPAPIERARLAVGRCDRIATVLSLESRRLVPISGSPLEGGSARVQDLLGRVRAGLDDLGASLAEIESASAVVGNGIHFDTGRRHWVRLLQGLDALDRRLGELDDTGTPAADAETTDITEETT